MLLNSLDVDLDSAPFYILTYSMLQISNGDIYVLFCKAPPPHMTLYSNYELNVLKGLIYILGLKGLDDGLI